MTTRPVSTPNKKTTPPQFKEGMSYKLWNNKIQMQQLVTSIGTKDHCFLIRIIRQQYKSRRSC